MPTATSAPWNGEGSCLRGGYACIACTEPGFEAPGHPFQETPKIAGIPIGLPTDMPKAWFVALAVAVQVGDAEARARQRRRRSPGGAPGRQEGRANETHLSSAPSTASKAISRSVSTSRTGRSSRRGSNSPLYRGFEQMLAGRAPHDALVIVPRICGICSVCAVGRRGRGRWPTCARLEPPPNGRLAAASDPGDGEPGRPPDALLPLLHARFRARRLR